jgi:RNA polymerase sigma-70 factor, ECF subfamily
VIGSPTDTDAQLLLLAHAGEADALAQLLDRYEAVLFRYVLGVLRDRHAAEDVLQETFVVAIRSIHQARTETCRSWFFSVAHQQAMLWKRKQKRVPVLVKEPDWTQQLHGSEDDGPTTAMALDDHAKLHRLLGQLPSMQRDVLQLRLFEGLKFVEVAQRLGCPLNTALSRMRDGLERLRTLWETST